MLTYNPALHLPLLFLSTALEEIWKCFTDGRGLQEEALSSTRCPGLPAPGCSGWHAGSAGHSEGQSGTQGRKVRDIARDTAKDTARDIAGHSEGHSERQCGTQRETQRRVRDTARDSVGRSEQ